MPFHFIQTHGYIRLNYFLIPTSLAHAFDLPDGNFFSVHCIASYPEKSTPAALQKFGSGFKDFRMCSLRKNPDKIFFLTLIGMLFGLYRKH